MKKLLTYGMLFALFAASVLLFPPLVFSQNGLTSMGTDYWLGFMPNSLSLNCCPPQGVMLFIASATDNDVHVDVYGGSQIPNETHDQQMTANSVWTVTAPSEANWETDVTERVAYRAIHVYARSPIAVYGYQYTGVNTSSTDSYLALPTPALGTEYYPSCYYDDHYSLGPSNPLAGQFLIISPYDNNVVTIGPLKTPTRSDPNADTILHQRGDTWNVKLMKGQTYLVQSTGLNYGDGDLTGTHIVSTKPIALISGHQLCSIPIGELADQDGSKDEIMEMVPSLDKWGSEYYDMPTATRTVCGDLVRVIAGQDSVTVTATSSNRSVVAQLSKAGDFYDFDQITDPTVFSSQGGKKFLAVQMAYSQNYLGDPGISDPFSTVLTPHQQFQKKLIFSTPIRAGVAAFYHYGTFICREDSILKIMINGKPIGAYTPAGHLTFQGTTPLMGAYRVQFPGDATAYLATCPEPFGCYLYGWSSYESYGHPASLGLATNSTDTLPPLAQTLDSSCGNFHIRFSEPRSNDTRIAYLSVITDSRDPRWATPSYNYSFTQDSNFAVADSVVTATLTVNDPTKAAYAAIFITDLAGNDTVYQYSYSPPLLTVIPPSLISFGAVPVAFDSCKQIVLRNGQSSGSITITNAALEGGDTAGRFSFSPAILNKVLHSGDTLDLDVCYTPSDTLLSTDTLSVATECATFRVPLQAIGVTPIIIAGDLDFGNISVGDTICKMVTIQNAGSATLVLSPDLLLRDSINFSFLDKALFPDTIAPGRTVSFEICFHPEKAGPVQSGLDWGTNLPSAFIHQAKDTSLLTGKGVEAGVHDEPTSTLSLNIISNVDGLWTISLQGAPSANVEIFDMLSREVQHFMIEGSYEWNTSALPRGTYIVRAKSGTVMITKKINLY